MDNLTSFLWLNDDGNDARSEPSSSMNDTLTLEHQTSAQQQEDSYGSYSAAAAQTILNFLNLYYLGAVIIVGVVGNGRNVYLFVMRNKKKELSSPSYYLVALALADVLFLVTLFLLWLGHFVGDYLLVKPGFQQFLFYLSSTSSCISGSHLFYSTLIPFLFSLKII